MRERDYAVAEISSTCVKKMSKWVKKEERRRKNREEEGEKGSHTKKLSSSPYMREHACESARERAMKFVHRGGEGGRRKKRERGEEERTLLLLPLMYARVHDNMQIIHENI